MGGSKNISRRIEITIGLLITVVGAAIAWYALGSATGQGAEDTTSNTSSTPTPLGITTVDLSERQASTIQTSPVPIREFTRFKNAVGAIGFNEDQLVQVFAQYPGKILKAGPNLGDDVTTGDILFTIDSPDLLQAESTLLAAAGVLALQKRTLARLTTLVKDGGAAQKDLDQTISDEQTAEGNFKAARDSVRIFGKTDAEIDRVVDMRKVDAILLVASPISGTIVAKSAAPGFLTQPGNAPAPYTVANLSTLWMTANVVESDAPAYMVGQEVEVTVPSYPDTVFRGRVTTLGSMIDPNTRRLLVRSQIDDPQHMLRAGMFASFVIRVVGPMRSPAVPINAVVRESDGTMAVWVTSDRRRFTRRTVAVGLQLDGWDQIQDGLQAGEDVVIDGAVFLSNALQMASPS